MKRGQHLRNLTVAEAPQRGFEDEDYRLAAVAPLVHVASADGPVDLPERRKLQAIIKERFGLDAQAAERLTAAAAICE